MEQFFLIQMPIKSDSHKETIRKLLILSFKAFEYKSKPHHDKRIKKYVTSIRNFPQLNDFCEKLNLDPLGGAAPAEETKVQE